MADALGIRTDAKDKSGGITYHEQVVAFGRGNVKFVQVVEKAFAEYVGFDLMVWMRRADVLCFCVGSSLRIKGRRCYRICLRRDESSCTT